MDKLQAGSSLGVDQQLTSDNGKYVLTMQGDGNLVLSESGRAVWGSGTSGTGASRAEMQGDGNFVLYTNDGKPIWSTDTAGTPNASILLQGDRNLVISGPDGKPIWSSDTSTGETASSPAAAPKVPAAAGAVPAAQAPTRQTVTASTASKARTYTVVSGDTLWDIAERYYGNGQEYPKIAKANNIANPDAINVGQKLIIP